MPTLPEISKSVLQAPGVEAVNPSSRNIDMIFRNIENEPLIKRIKALEEKLEALLGKRSVEVDLEGMASGYEKKPDINNKERGTKKSLEDEVSVFKELLDDFNELLETPYGSLGYLVKSNSEDILKIYGVDTDEDYYVQLEGSTIRISSERLEKAVRVGARRFIGEEGSLLKNPAETKENMKVADHAIHEIIYAIHEKLEKLDEKIAALHL